MDIALGINNTIHKSILIAMVYQYTTKKPSLGSQILPHCCCDGGISSILISTKKIYYLELD